MILRQAQYAQYALPEGKTFQLGLVAVLHLAVASLAGLLAWDLLHHFLLYFLYVPLFALKHSCAPSHNSSACQVHIVTGPVWYDSSAMVRQAPSKLESDIMLLLLALMLIYLDFRIQQSKSQHPCLVVLIKQQIADHCNCK